MLSSVKDSQSLLGTSSHRTEETRQPTEIQNINFRETKRRKVKKMQKEELSKIKGLKKSKRTKCQRI